MPDAKSGRVHILRQLAVPSGVAAEDTGNHLLLSVTRRSERCRSGSEISGARLYQRQGAERRSGGVEGCGIRDELIAEAVEALACKTIIRGFESHPRLQIYGFSFNQLTASFFSRNSRVTFSSRRITGSRSQARCKSASS